MKIQRQIFVALLAFLLLFSQQFGFLHALTHISKTGNPNFSRQHQQYKFSQPSQPTPLDQLCEKCLTYAQTNSILHQTQAFPTSLPFTSEHFSFNLYKLHFLKAFGVSKARAPPSLFWF